MTSIKSIASFVKGDFGSLDYLPIAVGPGYVQVFPISIGVSVGSATRHFGGDLDVLTETAIRPLAHSAPMQASVGLPAAVPCEAVLASLRAAGPCLRADIVSVVALRGQLFAVVPDGMDPRQLIVPAGSRVLVTAADVPGRRAE